MNPSPWPSPLKEGRGDFDSWCLVSAAVAFKGSIEVW
jgi:hypothetical protein